MAYKKTTSRSRKSSGGSSRRNARTGRGGSGRSSSQQRNRRGVGRGNTSTVRVVIEQVTPTVNAIGPAGAFQAPANQSRKSQF